MIKKKQKIDTDRKFQQRQDMKEVNHRSGCTCLNVENIKDTTDTRPSKSRVTIFGQLGRTEDDKYILKCAAKINDRPITADFTPGTKNHTKEDNQFKQVTSHGVQVNLGMYWNTLDLNNNNHNQATQYQIQDTIIETNANEVQNDVTFLKKSNSPVIIISVYPRHEVAITPDKAKLKQKVSSRKKNNSPERNHSKFTAKEIKISNVPQRIRSRSISPTMKSYKKKPIDHESSLSSRTNKSNFRFRKYKSNIDLKKKLSQKSSNKNYKDVTSTKLREPVKMNTIVKKGLVDNFIKNIDSKNNNYEKYFVSVPKSNASKITINLNDDKEHYDVILRKKNLNTDISVQQTLKTNRPSPSNKHTNVKAMEDFLMLKGDKSNLTQVSNNKEKNKSQKTNADGMLKTSQLKVRDSIELNHCRGKRGDQPKEDNKNKRNCYSAGISGSTKHYRGDHCLVQDPIIRDKEIRELLGLIQNHYKKKPSDFEDADILKKTSSLTKCSKNLVTLVYETINKHLEKKAMKKVLCKTRDIESLIRTKSDLSILKRNRHILDEEKPLMPSHFRNNHCSQRNNDLFNRLIEQNSGPSDCGVKNDISQNMLFRNNIQVFLQIQQPFRRKRIHVTKIQCNKLKKTTEATVLKKVDAEMTTKNGKSQSNVSLGKIKMKLRSLPFSHLDQEVQTEKVISENNVKCVQTELQSTCIIKDINDAYLNKVKTHLKSVGHDDLTKNVTEVKVKKTRLVYPRVTKSLMDLRYTKDTYTQQNSSEYFNIKGDGLDVQKSITDPNNISIYTIFKVRKRSVTPNLGSSEYSLRPNLISTHVDLKQSKVKLKKPLLKRIISCIIMRFTRDSNEHLRQEESQKSSSSLKTWTDSYHVNTSLGAWEMSSALYDTSASFYSNHGILPVMKSKRGLFSSVRGYLSKRRT